MYRVFRLKALRRVALSKLSKAQLTPEDFGEFGVDVEDVQINSAQLKSVQDHAFRGIHGVKGIDLSGNAIESVEKDAFVDVRMV